MTTALEELRPGTLVRDHEGQVLSARHRVFELAQGDFTRLTSGETELRERIATGDLEIVDPGVEPSIPTCLGCGCTEDWECPGGCTWVDDNACSRCVGTQTRSREEIQTDTEAAFGCVVRENEAVARLLVIQGELLLDIRDALHFTAANQHSVLRALHTSAEASTKARIFTASGALLR